MFRGRLPDRNSEGVTRRNHPLAYWTMLFVMVAFGCYFIHMAAAVPNFAWLEVRVTQAENLYSGKTGVSDADALFPVQPRLVGNSFPLPTAPGLGIEMDLERAEGQTWKFWEAPHNRRADGSVTNW